MKRKPTDTTNSTGVKVTKVPDSNSKPSQPLTGVRITKPTISKPSSTSQTKPKEDYDPELDLAQQQDIDSSSLVEEKSLNTTSQNIYIAEYIFSLLRKAVPDSCAKKHESLNKEEIDWNVHRIQECVKRIVTSTKCDLPNIKIIENKYMKSSDSKTTLGSSLVIHYRNLRTTLSVVFDSFTVSMLDYITLFVCELFDNEFLIYLLMYLAKKMKTKIHKHGFPSSEPLRTFGDQLSYVFVTATTQLIDDNAKKSVELSSSSSSIPIAD